VLSVTFELHGLQLVGLNGGPSYEFTPAISLFVDCEDQDEVDYYWERLLDGGRADQCGWLQDRYGVSWQIVPKRLGELLGDPDPERSGRVMTAMLQMVKLDVAALEEAYRA
jgi:predicted 3-demethylubiquinone-9 3-methyltransferase (glyoxalase superfamily)